MFTSETPTFMNSISSGEFGLISEMTIVEVVVLVKPLSVAVLTKLVTVLFAMSWAVIVVLNGVPAVLGLAMLLKAK